LKSYLAVGAGIILVVSALLWFVVMVPEPEAVTYSPAELLADGMGHYERKEYDQALEVLRQVPDGSVEKAQALYYEGSSYVMLKDHELAVPPLEQALALKPRDTGTLYALGVASFKLGNLPLAKGYFAALLEINPNDEQAKGLYDIMARLERQSVAESEDPEPDASE
jgi:tetratricopeptide (TPR) repeat protein